MMNVVLLTRNAELNLHMKYIFECLHKPRILWHDVFSLLCLIFQTLCQQNSIKFVIEFLWNSRVL